MAANATDSAIQKYVNPPEQIFASSEHSTDSTSQIVEICSDGSKKHLEEVKESPLDSLLKELSAEIDSLYRTNKGDEEIEISSDDSEESAEEETSSDDSENSDTVVEIRDDGSKIQLERAGLTEEQKKLLFSILLLVLLAQASCFSAFQILNFIIILMEGSASETEQLIAVWSTLSLLVIAAGTVLSETTIRFINWFFAEAKEAQVNWLLFLIDLFKTITVSLFCASFYLEQVKTFNPAVAKTGSIFFPILVGSESVVDAVISACTPSKKYLSTTFFIDSILKALICVAAVMELYPETALAGFAMAAMLFALVAMSVILIWLNDRADVENARLQSTLLQHANIQAPIYVTVDSASNDSDGPSKPSDRTPLRENVRLSQNQLTFFKRISRYLCAEGSFPTLQPQESTLKK
jgi:hypothetical protein